MAQVPACLPHVTQTTPSAVVCLPDATLCRLDSLRHGRLDSLRYVTRTARSAVAQSACSAPPFSLPAIQTCAGMAQAADHSPTLPYRFDVLPIGTKESSEGTIRGPFWEEIFSKLKELVGMQP